MSDYVAAVGNKENDSTHLIDAERLGVFRSVCRLATQVVSRSDFRAAVIRATTRATTVTPRDDACMLRKPIGK